MEFLTDVEKDAILGCLNISMGSASTALATLLDKTVFITSPELEEVSVADIMSSSAVPFVYADVKYIEGLEGGSVFIFKEKDIMVINNLLHDIAPEDGLLIPDNIQEGVIGEAINKMIGFSVTAMSEMFDRVIAISPPIIERLASKTNDFAPSLAGIEGKVLQIAFSFKVEELIDSTLMQIIPLELAQKMARVLLDDLNRSMETSEQETTDATTDTTTDVEITPEGGEEFEVVLTPEDDDADIVPELTEEDGDAESFEEQLGGVLQPETEAVSEKPDEVNRILWSKEDLKPAGKEEKTLTFEERMQKLEMVKDIPIELTVVLGRNNLPMGDLLAVGKGSLVPLKRYAREPVDILVNDQMVAKGEIVIVDGKLGVRITSIESKLPKMSQKSATR